MNESLSSLLLLLSVSSLSYLEIKKVNQIITPFTVIAWPLTIISFCVNFIFVHIGCSMVTIRVNLFILTNLLVIWFIGMLVSYYLYKPRPKINYKEVFQFFEPYKYFIILISWLILIVYFYNVYSLIGSLSNLWYLGDPLFEEQITNGIQAHLMHINRINFILLFMLLRKSRNKIIITFTLFVLFLSFLSYPVKYGLFWAILIIFFLHILQKSPRKQIKFSLVITGLLFILFIAMMTIVAQAWGTFEISRIKIWEFLIKQLLNYFISGPVVLDYWMDFPGLKPSWTLLIPFKNILNILMGDPNRIDVIKYVTIRFYPVFPGFFSNIGTGFGVYYLIGGYFFTLIMSCLYAILGYILYIKWQYSKNINGIFFNSFFLTLGTLSFFGQYFSFISIYELSFFFVLYYYSFKIFNYLKTLKI